MEHWVRALLVAAAILGGVSTAMAQEEEPDEDRQHLPLADQGAQDRARLHFQAGASYYEAGSYEDALREWRHAYELSQRPELLYNLSLAYQGMGDLENAVSHLERFLEEVQDVPNRANLELRVRNFRERIEAQSTQTDGDENAEVDAAEATDVAASVEVEASADPGGAAPSGGGPNVGAIAGFSVAAVGVVMVAITGSLTIVEDGNLAERCMSGCTDADVADLQTFALVTDIGFGVALAGAALGAVLLLIGGDDGGDDGGDTESASLTPWVGPSGGGAAVRGSF